MNMQQQTIKDFLGTKYGNERSARVIGSINHAYKNGTQGEKLSEHLWAVLKEEGISTNKSSILYPWHIYLS